MPGILGLGTLAMLTVVAVSLSVILGFGIFPVEGRTIVPLAGMMIGNSMTASVLVGRRIVGELSDKRDEVEARLALGHSWPDAARPYVRSALRTGLVPQIESTKAVGLVFLPGAMTGLVLAGVDAGRRRVDPAGDHVPDPRLGGHEHHRDRPRAHPPAVHPRPPAAPPREGGRRERGSGHRPGGGGRVAERRPGRPGRATAAPGRDGHRLRPRAHARRQGAQPGRGRRPAGVPVVMIGSVGDDDHGRWLREVARAEGIDVASVATVGRRDGHRAHHRGRRGRQHHRGVPGANGATGREVATALTTLALGPADVVLGQAEIPAAAVVAALRAGRAAGATTIVNQAPFRPLDDELWALVDVLVVNETELDELVAGPGGREPVVDEDGPVGRRSRRGHGRRAAPCWRRDPGRVPSSSPSVATAPWPSPPTVRSSSVPGRVVDAVDTVGAGDCLAGWLAAGLAGGRALGPALERAVVAASLAVQRTGAAAAMPDVTEVDAAR